MTEIDKVRAAYAGAGTVQPLEYPRLPAWETLPIALREAIIHVWYRAKRDRISLPWEGLSHANHG
jgi:hypothetical protein